jgi:fatty acid desaturase
VARGDRHALLRFALAPAIRRRHFPWPRLVHVDRTEPTAGFLPRPPAAPRTLARLGTVVALYGVLGVIGVAAGRWWVWVPVWIGQGVLLVCLASAAHYASHGTLFRSRRANRVAGVAAYLPLCLNFSCDQAFHRQHHARTRVDGDTETYVAGRNVVEYLGALVLGGPVFVAENWWMAARTVVGRPPPWIRGDQTGRVRVDAAVGVAWVALVGIAVAIGPAWVVPTLLGGVGAAVLGVAAAMAFPEHYRCDDVSDATRNTRSLQSNAVFRWLHLNGAWHAAHHLAPNVPYDALGAVHARVEPTLAHVSSGWLSFHAAALAAVLRGDRGPVHRRTIVAVEVAEAAGGAEAGSRGPVRPRPELDRA